MDFKEFINQVILVEEEQSKSQLEYDTKVLSAAVVYMADYYESIFNGLDAMLKTVSDIEKKTVKKAAKWRCNYELAIWLHRNSQT